MKQGQNTKQLLILVLLGLCCFFSPFFSDALNSPDKGDLMEISVLLREPETSNWSNTRSGMEQAALDWGVELRFLTLSNSNAVDEQLALLTSEAKGGADGIILAPCDPEFLRFAVQDLTQITPIVTIESKMEEYNATAYVGIDQEVAGRLLAAAVLRDVPEGGTVLLINSAPASPGITQRLQIAKARIEMKGRNVEVYTPTDWNNLTLHLLTTLLAVQPDALVAFEPQLLEQVTTVTHNMGRPPLLYGVGATDNIIGALERGRIAAIVVENEYAIGYLSVESLVQHKYSLPPSPTQISDVKLIYPEDMYDPEIQKLLFPVTH